MHELSIAQALVEQLEAIVARERADRVAAVLVRVGGLSGVNPEALRMAFPVAAEGTVAHGADLRVAETGARMTCRACEHVWSPSFPVPLCEECGSTDVECTGGRDLVFESAELVTEEE